MKTYTFILSLIASCLLSTIKVEAQDFIPYASSSFNVGVGLNHKYLSMGARLPFGAMISAEGELRYHKNSFLESHNNRMETRAPNLNDFPEFIGKLDFVVGFNLHFNKLLDWVDTDIMIGYNTSIYKKGVHVNFQHYFTDKIGAFARARYVIGDGLLGQERNLDETKFEAQVGVAIPLVRKTEKSKKGYKKPKSSKGYKTYNN